MNIQKNNDNVQFEDQKQANNSSTLLINPDSQCIDQDLLAKSKLPNMDIKDSITSVLPKIDNQKNDNEGIKVSKIEQTENLKKYLTPKLPEITFNDRKNLMEESLPYITSSSASNSLQDLESKENETCNFMKAERSPRSVSPASLSGSPASSVYHDALDDREECWKLRGESLIGVGLGIDLGQKYGQSTKRLQHDMLARAEESNARLQKELGECQKKSSLVVEQLSAENQKKWTEWQGSKEQHYKEEIQRMKDEHASELSAHKETLQKAIKSEIIREKARLVQEYNSRISQEVTKACKKQELRIKQLNRTNRNLREEKQGQEMDMEAYREKIAGQEEDLLRVNKRVPELMQSLGERNQEVERLHAKIEGLEKTLTEVYYDTERTGKELQKTRQQLEATKKEIDYELDSASDAESASGSNKRPWGSGRRTSKSKDQELKLKILSEQLAKGKAVIESQSCQINQLKEEILDLARAREEDDTTIKVQGRRIHSLEALPQRLFALSESFDNLKDDFHNLSRAEEQGKATIKQLQNEIDQFVATRAELREARESLIEKETDLNEIKIKIQHDEAIIKQQQKGINELTITKTKLNEIQESLDAKQIDLSETMIKLQHYESITEQQQKEIEKLMITGMKLKEVQESLDAKRIDLNEAIIELEHKEAIIKQQHMEIEKLMITRIKLEEVQESLDAKQITLAHDDAIIKQQRKKIHELVITRARLEKVQESLDAKQADLNKTMIKLERDEAIIKRQQAEIHELVITRVKLKELQRSLNVKQTDLEKTIIELEQANRELQNLRKSQQWKAGSVKSIRERPVLADRSINSERNVGAGSLHVDKQSPLPNIRKSAHSLVLSTNKSTNNNSNSATSPPWKIELLGAEDISEKIDEDDYDDGSESLNSILQRAVAGGAAILRRLEMRPSEL